MNAFNPKFICDHPNKCIARLENFVIYLIQHKVVKLSKGDIIVGQYKELVAKIRSKKRHEAMAFRPSQAMPLDGFFSNLIGSDEFKVE